MVQKKLNLDEWKERAKDLESAYPIKNNNFNFKVEEILSEKNIQLEGTKGRIRKLEKKTKFLEKIQHISIWIFIVSFIPGGVIPIIILIIICINMVRC